MSYVAVLLGGMASWYLFSVGITFYNKWLFLVGRTPSSRGLQI